MYDYMKALQRQFETDCQSIQDLSDEVKRNVPTAKATSASVLTGAGRGDTQRDTIPTPENES